MGKDGFGIDDLLSSMRESSRNYLRVVEETFEDNFARTMMVTAMMYAQLEDQKKTTDQVGNNELTRIVIDHQLERYKNEYNDLPNKMRHYG